MTTNSCKSLLIFACVLSLLLGTVTGAWLQHLSTTTLSRKIVQCRIRRIQSRIQVLSSDFLENDLVTVKRSSDEAPRLCAVGQDNNVIPLCQRADDDETTLFADPRESSDGFWMDPPGDEVVTQRYEEAWYGQLPVPSLGGGPGYGAEADETWTTTDEVLEQVHSDGVEIPVLDMGIAHGEKARGGAF